MSTEQQPLEAAPVRSVDLAERPRGWTSGTYVAWGFALTVVGILLVVADLPSLNNGDTNGDAIAVGVIALILGAPLLLLGLVAAGVRLGMNEHAADRAGRHLD